MKCNWCERTDTVVTVNDKRACVDHIDAAMGEALAPAKNLMDFAKEYLSPPDPPAIIDVTLMGTTYRNVAVDRSKYAKGGVALLLFDGPELVATATVWLPTQPAEGCVWIKDWSENEGMFDSLVAAGVIEETGAVCSTGFVVAREGRLL